MSSTSPDSRTAVHTAATSTAQESAQRAQPGFTGTACAALIALFVFAPAIAAAAAHPATGTFAARPSVCLPEHAEATTPKGTGDAPFFQSSFETSEDPHFPEIGHIDPVTLTVNVLPRLDDSLPPMPSDWIVVSEAQTLSEPAPLDGATQLSVAGFFDMVNVLEPGPDAASIPNIRAIGLYLPWESTQYIPISAETTALALVLDFLGTFNVSLNGGLKAGIESLRNEPELTAITAHIQAHLLAGTPWIDDEATWELVVPFLPRAAEVIGIEPTAREEANPHAIHDCLPDQKSGEFHRILSLSSSGKLTLRNSVENVFPYMPWYTMDSGVTLQALDDQGRYIPSSTGVFTEPVSVNHPLRTFSAGPLDIDALTKLFVNHSNSVLPGARIASSAEVGVWNDLRERGGHLNPFQWYRCRVYGNLHGDCDYVTGDVQKLEYQIPEGVNRMRMCIAAWDPLATLNFGVDEGSPYLGLDVQDYALRDAAFASSMSNMIAYVLEWLQLIPKADFGSSTAGDLGALVSAILLRQGDDYAAVYDLALTLAEKGMVLLDDQAPWSEKFLAAWAIADELKDTVETISFEAGGNDSFARKAAKMMTGDAANTSNIMNKLANAKKAFNATKGVTPINLVTKGFRYFDMMTYATIAHRTRVNAETSVDAIKASSRCYILTRMAEGPPAVDIKISESREGRMKLPPAPGQGIPDAIELGLTGIWGNPRTVTAMLSGAELDMSVGYFMPDITLGEGWVAQALATRNGEEFMYNETLINDVATAPTLIYTKSDMTLCGTSVPDPDFTIPFDPNVLFMELGATRTGTVDFIEGYNGRPAAKFHGVDNTGRLIIPQNMVPVFDDNEGATFDIMVRRDSNHGMTGGGATVNSGSAQTLFAKDHDRNGTIGLIQGDQSVTWVQNHGTTTWNPNGEVVVNEPDIELGEWHRVTMTASRTSGVSVYVNGILTRHRNTPSLSFAPMNARNLIFGGFSDYWYPFNGAIQDFRIYKRALSACEVSAIN